MKKSLLNHIIFVVIVFLFTNGNVVAQKVNEILLNDSFQNQPLKDFLTVLHEKYGLKVFYKDSWIESYSITKTFENTPLLQALNNVLVIE